MIPPVPHAGRDSPGGVALVVLLGGGLLAGFALALIVAATDYAAAAARARTAADAAALAAAGASPLAGGDGDAETAADRLARANGARLRACCGEAVGGAGRLPDARVEVGVAAVPRTALVRAFAPEVAVRAAASLAPPEGFDGLAAAEELWSGDPPAHERPAARPPPAAGRMQWPVAGPVTSPYGWRVHPIAGERRFHAGIDIGAPAGTLIRAAADGVVVSAGDRGGYGLTVIVDHGGGLTTLYAHQSRLAVSVGQRVGRGDVIGAVGATGYATGPHLHFEVRARDRPQDPRRYL